MLVTVDVPLFTFVKSINMNLKVNVYVFVFTKSFNCFLFLPIALNRKTSQLNSLIILATFPAQPKQQHFFSGTITEVNVAEDNVVDDTSVYLSSTKYTKTMKLFFISKNWWFKMVSPCFSSGIELFFSVKSESYYALVWYWYSCY